PRTVPRGPSVPVAGNRPRPNSAGGGHLSADQACTAINDRSRTVLPLSHSTPPRYFLPGVSPDQVAVTDFCAPTVTAWLAGATVRLPDAVEPSRNEWNLTSSSPTPAGRLNT